MVSLQIRKLPENIYALLKRKAEAEHRSIAQEAIVLLAKGLVPQLLQKSVLPGYYKELKRKILRRIPSAGMHACKKIQFQIF